MSLCSKILLQSIPSPKGPNMVYILYFMIEIYVCTYVTEVCDCGLWGPVYLCNGKSSL